ncbi:MAG: hypothetical protein JF592_14640 [Microbacterium sp.]|uniref:hypothetical protein n=1 Tax=Microbacterium sp. TaxID=51671 RepID=UPI001D999828|nr:hypothetical protein [Microbacterium sp.]MBW8763798.1 hypothetical protein [Microbacterium sp.]
MTAVRSLIAIATGVLLAITAVSPADAVDDGRVDVAPEVAQMLEEVPGGVLIDGHHAVWPALHMELVVPTGSPRSFSASSVGPCPSGGVCLFAGYSLGGTMLAFSTCGIHSIPSSFSARSLAHARSSGYTQARNGTTVLATAYVGGWANIYGTTTNLRCVL